MGADPDRGMDLQAKGAQLPGRVLRQRFWKEPQLTSNLGLLSRE